MRPGDQLWLSDPPQVPSPAPSACPPSFPGSKDPVGVQSLHVGPQRTRWDSASRHHHLPGSKQDPKTQADISFTKFSGASWPHLLQNQMPGNSSWPAKSPSLRDVGLADMCLCPSWSTPPPPCLHGTPQPSTEL